MSSDLQCCQTYEQPYVYIQQQRTVEVRGNQPRQR